MSIQLRILLIVAAIGVTALFVQSVRKAAMRIEDTLFWAFLSALTVLISIFPQIAIWVSEWLGFQAPVNFVFLFFIFILTAKCFSLNKDNSLLHTKLKELTQQVAVDKLEHYERDAPRGNSADPNGSANGTESRQGKGGDVAGSR